MVAQLRVTPAGGCPPCGLQVQKNVLILDIIIILCLLYVPFDIIIILTQSLRLSKPFINLIKANFI